MLPIIKNYQTDKRVQKNIQGGIFRDMTLKLDLYNSPSLYNSVADAKIFGFGPLVGMKGTANCNSVEHLRSDVHEYFKEKFCSGTLCGSIAIKRNILNHQHFVLDFDLKENVTKTTEHITMSDYKHYVKNRNNTTERKFMTQDIEVCTKFNSNYFVYEIVYFLTGILKLDWLPIYIFGKGGTFQNGFHLEIPHLIMSYHDISVLSNACHICIPNSRILDSPANYSCFGSHKYHPEESFHSVKELNCAYLPYVTFSGGQFNNCASISSFSEAFDTFNIFKPINPDDKVYAFKIFSHVNESNITIKRIIDILRENDSYKNVNNTDNTIPESELRKSDNGSDSDEVNELASIILANINVENDIDSEYGDTHNYLIGFKSHKPIKNNYQRTLLYKCLCLSNEIHFRYYKNVFKDLFDYSSIISEDLNGKNLVNFITKKNFMIYLYGVPNYNMGDSLENNFTNSVMFPQTISTCPDFNITDNDYPTVIPIMPYNIEHLLKLCAIDSRRSNTVYYLVCIYFLAEEIKGMEYYTSLASWLYSLCSNGDLIHFLNIFSNLKLRIRDNTLELNEAYQNWAIICLKHLLIVEDTMSFVEANALFANYEDTVKRDITIPGAMNDIKIPEIVMAYLVNYSDDNAPLVYEILALYRPMLQVRNSMTVWDDVSHVWKIASTQNGVVNTALYAPDIHHVGSIFSFLRNGKKRKRDADGDGGGSGGGGDDGEGDGEGNNREESSTSRGKTMTNTKEKEKEKPEKKTITMATIVNNIQAYWCRINLIPIPSILWKFTDCYFLTGTSNAGELVDILPLPMYLTSQHADCVRGIDSNALDNLMHHILECPFIQTQLYPIFWRLMDEENDTDNTTSADMRAVIDSRDTFVQVFDDQSVQIDMEINANHAGGRHDARSLIPCNIEETLHERRRLANLSRDQYHLELVDRQWNDDTRELVKMVKFFVLKEMSNSYGDMNNVTRMSGDDSAMKRVLHEYVQQSEEERKIHEMERVGVLATTLYNNLYSHPHMSLISDIGIDEMTETKCDCPMTYIFITLLQTFSYDVVALRYVLSLVLASVCYGNKLKNKEIYFFLGNTNSGKTQFLKLLLSVMGEMGGILSSNTAYYGCSQDRIHDVGKSGDSARFWYMDETVDKPLNALFLKRLTGRSPMWIRSNYSSGSMQILAPSVFMFGNNKPTFTENCPALIDRLRFYTFRSTFSNKEVTSFKCCFFPQLRCFESIQSKLSMGMMALLLHATCHKNFNSPMYLFCTLRGGMDMSANFRESSIMYSPTVSIVRAIMQICNIVDESTGAITVKRVIDLLIGLNVLKCVNIVCPFDALKFLDKFYPKTSIQNENIECPDQHKDTTKGVSVIYQGICEKNIGDNDEKIYKMQQRENNKLWKKC